jgi:diguanylate cyclase (GGDEF)-like protein
MRPASPAADTHAIVRTAAGIYAGAIVIALVEQAIPGGPTASLGPGIVALVVAPLVALFGRRLPRAALALLGPLGAALIAFALESTSGWTDGAVLYMWPVLWMSHFYGRRGTVFIVAWVGVVHGIALAAMPPGVGNIDRWVDVVVSVAVVAAVVRTLSARYDALVAHLTAEARADTLTGLLNRRGFEERFAAEVSRASRERASLALVSFDLDHFKRVNDEQGHEAGDRALAMVGAMIADQVRGADLAARWGGEEFAVVLPRAGAGDAFAFAERVRAGVARASGGTLTLSAGVATAAGPSDARALLAAADRALYDAKRAGRDRTVVAPSSRAAV